MEAMLPFSPRTWSCSTASDKSTASNIKSDGAACHVQEESSLSPPPSQLRSLKEQMDGIASCMSSLREEVQQISVQRRLDAAFLEEGLLQRDLREDELSSLATLRPIPEVSLDEGAAEALQARVARCEQQLAAVSSLKSSQLVVLENEVVLHSWQAEMTRTMEGFRQKLAEAAEKHTKELLDIRAIQAQHSRRLEEGIKTLEGHVHVVDARMMDVEQVLGDRGVPLPPPTEGAADAATSDGGGARPLVAALEQLRGRLGDLEEASTRLGRTQLELVRSSAQMVSIHEAVKDRLSTLEVSHGEGCQGLSEQIQGLRERVGGLERQLQQQPPPEDFVLAAGGRGPNQALDFKARFIEEVAVLTKQHGSQQSGLCAEPLDAASLGDRVEFLEGMLGESVELVLAQAKSASDAKALRQDYRLLEERLRRVEGGLPLSSA